MLTVTLQEAKAKLHQLIERALAGEEVVFMRGAQIVAMLQPISSEDIEIAPKLTDAQAKRFWEETEKEKKRTFGSTAKAIQALKKSV